MKLGISYMVFNGEELLGFAVKHIRTQVDYISVVYQTVSYYGEPASPDLIEILQDLKHKKLVDKLIHYEPKLSMGHKPIEAIARNLGIQASQDFGCTHHLAADVDEFYTSEQMKEGKELIERENVECSIVGLVEYYKHPTYRIHPNRSHSVPFIHKIQYRYDLDAQNKFRLDKARKLNYLGEFRVLKDEVVMHHMSYIRKDIRSKVANTINRNTVDINRFVVDFENYQLGDKLKLPPDFINRKTALCNNVFQIEV